MDLSPTLVVGSGTAEPPRPIPDQRPTADAAALSRSPRPDLPLGVPVTVPPGSGQTAAVARSLVEGSDPTGTPRPIERVLKPFGVAMLPSEARSADRDPQAREAPHEDASGPDRTPT